MAAPLPSTTKNMSKTSSTSTRLSLVLRPRKTPTPSITTDTPLTLQERKAEVRRLKIASTKAANRELALAARAQRTADVHVWLARRR